MTSNKPVTGLELSQILGFIDIRAWARSELSKPPPPLNSSERRDLQDRLAKEEAGFRTAVGQYDTAVSILKLRFILAPIRLLPSDLFKYIYDFLPQYVIPQDWKALMNVTNVSRHWREAVFENPRMWSYVHLGEMSDVLSQRPVHFHTLQPKVVDRWLRQSKAHPLHLKLMGDPEMCRIPAFEAAFPHFRRLKTLTLMPDDSTCSPVRLRRMLAALSSACGLKSLTLCWKYWPVTMDEQNRKVLDAHPMTFTELEELNLLQWPMRDLPLITAPKLRVLRLGDENFPSSTRVYHDCMDPIAGAFPSITDLAIAYRFPGYLHNIRCGQGVITFPNLVRFSVNCYRDRHDTLGSASPETSIHGSVIRGSNIKHLQIKAAHAHVFVPLSSSVTSLHIRVGFSSDYDSNSPILFEQLPALTELTITVESSTVRASRLAAADVIAAPPDRSDGRAETDRVSILWGLLRSGEIYTKTSSLRSIAIVWEGVAPEGPMRAVRGRVIDQLLLWLTRRHHESLGRSGDPRPFDFEGEGHGTCLVSLRNASRVLGNVERMHPGELFKRLTTFGLGALQLGPSNND
jgi:hypothetical protein